MSYLRGGGDLRDSPIPITLCAVTKSVTRGWVGFKKTTPLLTLRYAAQAL